MQKEILVFVANTEKYLIYIFAFIVKSLEFVGVQQVVPDAGHSANEPGITAELVAGNEKLKNIIQRNGP